MKTITLTDVTLRAPMPGGNRSFREKLETAKLLDKLCVDTIALGAMTEQRADVIFVKTLAASLQNAALALPVGYTAEEVSRAWEAVQGARHPRLMVDVPVSSVQMEYIAGKKPQAMLDSIAMLVKEAKSHCDDVMFSALDATRAEEDFLVSAIETALQAGATSVMLWDSAGRMLPQDFGRFLKEQYEKIPALGQVPVTVAADNAMDLAGAVSVCALQQGADGAAVSVFGTGAAKLSTLCAVLQMQGSDLGWTAAVRGTDLGRTLQGIHRLMGAEKAEAMQDFAPAADEAAFDTSDSLDVITREIRQLGYDLPEEEYRNIYMEFLRVAARKPVSRKELDVIVADNAMQVPSTYTLENYVINSGSNITATACVHLTRDGEGLSGISAGDGPIDAALKALEEITKRHFELEDFRIDAVTEGKEAIGRAVVHLRSEGRLYAGSGVSTDIVGASIRAYLGALNKIVYEEKEA